MSHKASGGYPQDYYVTVEPKKEQTPSKGPETNIETSNQQSEQSRIEEKYGSLDLNSMEQDAIVSSIDEMRRKIHQYQENINRKISKHYAELRPMPFESEKSVDNTSTFLTNQIEQSKKFIEFQLIEIKEIQQIQKNYDSRQNIEFDIPLEISATKKAIFQLERWIHIAEIKQKKKSEDLVKVDKTNLQQFERTAMLRTNLEVAMLYQINLNERQSKIDDHMYEFNCKIERLNEKLAQLEKIVQEKQIPVSSNKNLIVLKEKKAKIVKKRDDEMKKLMLMKHSFQKYEESLLRDKDQISKQIKIKEKRHAIIEQQIGQISQDSSVFLQDKQLQSKLRKSISFNYAQTLLTHKDKKELGGTKNSSQLYSSMGKSVDPTLNKSVLLSKPNFKVKRYAKNPSMNSSMEITHKDQQSPKKSLILPTTILKNPQRTEDILLRQSATLKLTKKDSKAKKINKYGDEFDLISDD